MASENRQNASALDPVLFRRTLGHFCSGIVVVTSAERGVPSGFTCQSFVSLSLDPPLVAFAPAVTSRSYPAIRRAGVFCVNVLGDAQRALALAFARSDDSKWQGVRWRPAGSGSPMLEGVIAQIDCRIETEYRTGDHFLVVGRVLSLETAPGAPLLYFKGDYASLDATRTPAP